jgi:hypothetical protein
MLMRIEKLFFSQKPFPRSPFYGNPQPIIDISRHFWAREMGKTPVISSLAQVAQAWHRQKGLHLCHFFSNIIEVFMGGTGGTGKNQHIAHARARAHARLKFLTIIWNIKNNTCATCDKSGIIKVSPVPPACATLCHLCQA